MTRDRRHSTAGAQVGDWIQARGLPGHPTREGQIIELLGSTGHEHFRVRWDEQHESILYPADGVTVLDTPPGHAPGVAKAR
jgi:Domain of unknown function (DUF1918)